MTLTIDTPLPWKDCFHRGFVPALSTAALAALRDALKGNSPALIQKATTDPPPISVCMDWPVGAACAIGYAGWQGEHLETVLDVETFFAAACQMADRNLGEPAGCRHFLNQYDEWTREEMVQNLLPEVEAALAARSSEQE